VPAGNCPPVSSSTRCIHARLAHVRWRRAVYGMGATAGNCNSSPAVSSSSRHSNPSTDSASRVPAHEADRRSAVSCAAANGQYGGRVCLKVAFSHAAQYGDGFLTRRGRCRRVKRLRSGHHPRLSSACLPRDPVSLPVDGRLQGRGAQDVRRQVPRGMDAEELRTCRTFPKGFLKGRLPGLVNARGSPVVSARAPSGPTIADARLGMPTCRGGRVRRRRRTPVPRGGRRWSVTFDKLTMSHRSGTVPGRSTLQSRGQPNLILQHALRRRVRQTRVSTSVTRRLRDGSECGHETARIEDQRQQLRACKTCGIMGPYRLIK